MAMSSSAVSHHMQGNNWGKLTLGLGTTRQKARWGTGFVISAKLFAWSKLLLLANY